MELWAEEIMRWLAQEEGPLGYVVLGLAAMIEYVVPPFPGDTVALFGVFLASSAGWSALGVYLALDVGAIAGGMAAYGFGRAISAPERRPRWMRGPRTERAITTITERYRERGAIYLALNRFVPALRAFFFVGAGIAQLPWTAVLLWGGLSALVWNALLLAVGWFVGSEWERMLALMRTYTAATLGLIAVVVVLAALRALWRWRAAKKAAADRTGDQ